MWRIVRAHGIDSATPNPPPPGHVTIGPTQQMSLDDFLDALGDLQWVGYQEKVTGDANHAE
jgi:hypothetical protein